MKRALAATVLVLIASACAEGPTDLAEMPPALNPLPDEDRLAASSFAWTDKVTGGAELADIGGSAGELVSPIELGGDAGACTFIISVSVSATDQDGVRGQVQYKGVEATAASGSCVPVEPEVLLGQWHGAVDGLLTADNGTQADLCGVITAGQGEGSNEIGGNYGVGDRFGVSIRKTVGSADRMRVATSSEINCFSFNGTFPATAISGGYSIRVR